MIKRTAMWFLVKFEEVIRAIENPLGADLVRYNQAGVLWSVTDSKGHSPLLYFIDKKTSDPKYAQADFVKHLRKLASVDPIQTEVGFRTGALQLLRNKDFMLLKALFDHFAILKPFIPNSDDPEKFSSLYAQILEGLCQFNARKVLPNQSRADQLSVFDSLYGELEKAAFHTFAMREGLIAALENDTETKVAIVKKILRYAHQQDNIIPLLQGATDDENIFVLLKKKSGAAYRIEMLLKSLALMYRQESNTQDALNFLHAVKMTDYEKSILLNAFTEKKLDVKKTSCEAPLSFSLLALNNNSLSYYSGNALSAWCNHHQLTVLDLSNNPMLGGADVRNVTYLQYSYSWMFSSGLQLIAKALNNNSTLKRLILAACGVDDKDFLTLVDMLKVNSGLRDLDLSQNTAITETEIQKNLPALYNLRYTRQLRALRPSLDSIIKKKEHSAFNIPSSQTIFHQHIRAHIEQLRLHSLGVQFKTQKVEVHHGSVLGQIGHFLHLMVLVSSTAGVVLGVVEILKTMKFTLHNFEHGFHKTEDIIEVFEKLYLGSMGLKIILDIITKIRETGGELSEEFYSRYQKHGFKQTTMRTFWDFIHYLYALLESEHKNDLLLFFHKFDQLAISINTDKVAAELAHNFSDCERRVNNPFEVELLTDTVAQQFNQFCYDSHVMIDWSCVAQEFSHWILAKEPVSSEVVKIDRGLVIFTGDEDSDRELRDQSDDEWAIDVIRRRGFQCYGKNNSIINFDLEFKKSEEVKQESNEWIKTDGERFGYRPIGKEFLRKIKDVFDTIQNATGYSEGLENNKLTVDKKQTDNTQIMYEEAKYIRHAVEPNGNCGYTAFGIDRKQAYQFIYAHIDAIRDIIKPVIRETLLTNETFVQSLEGYEGAKRDSENYFAALHRQDTNLQEYENNLTRHSDDLNLISAYIDYDVKDQQIDGGWCHPLILYALAHVRGVHLRLYEIGEDGKMIPHRRYPGHQPPNAADSAQLLFINRNHFERLELKPELSAQKSSSRTGNQSDAETLKKSQKPPQELLVPVIKFGVTYRIPVAAQRYFKIHETLSEIPSGYEPTEEQLSNIKAAITDLRAKVEALSKKTEENTAEIVIIKQRLDRLDLKPQQAGVKSQKLEGEYKLSDQPAPDLKQQLFDQAEVINAQGKKIVSLESEVDNLKKEKGEQQEKITRLEATVDNLTARVDALLGQQGQAIAAANNAALNADIAGRHADQQDALVQGQLVRANNNQLQAGAGNGALLSEDTPENQFNEEERGPQNPPIQIGQNLSRGDDALEINTINTMK